MIISFELYAFFVITSHSVLRLVEVWSSKRFYFSMKMSYRIYELAHNRLCLNYQWHKAKCVKSKRGLYYPTLLLYQYLRKQDKICIVLSIVYQIIRDVFKADQIFYINKFSMAWVIKFWFIRANNQLSPLRSAIRASCTIYQFCSMPDILFLLVFLA